MNRVRSTVFTLTHNKKTLFKMSVNPDQIESADVKRALNAIRNSIKAGHSMNESVAFELEGTLKSIFIQKTFNIINANLFFSCTTKN